MKAEQQGKILTLSFGFGWDERLGYIHKCVLKIDLSSATFYSGFWDRGWSGNGKWKQSGRKEEITIDDKNGMDLTYTGEQNYNQGTKHDLISRIVISFGTEPIANRVINEIYAIQESYKAKEPWLLPEPEPAPQKTVEVSSPSSTRGTPPKRSTSKTTGTKTITPKKIGKYVQ